jgi:flagellar assembly protein FliH
VRLVDEQLVNELIQTMLWLAQSCIGIEISQQQDKIQALLKTILEQWTEISGAKSLMMHPEDVDWIKVQLQSSRHQDLLENLHPDPSLKRGDFYLKSEHMELDGRLQSRLSQLFAEQL